MDAIEPLLDFGLGLRFQDIPAELIERTKLGILDTLAATVAGATGQSVPELTNLAMGWGGAPEATLASNGERLPVPLATLVNGMAGRAWDLDDVHEQNTCHTTVNVVAPALALAEARGGVDGRALLAAVLVGSEFICRMAAAPRLSFSFTGMSLSYQCGYLGAALTAARLIGLDRDRTRHALGIAYARLAGNQQGYVDGATTVRLMQGVAPEGGVVSALMAECGMTGAREILEGRFGYYPVFHRGVYERADLVDGLGERWRYPETSIKPVYPCCKYTHGPIEATVEAMRELGAGADAIERIDVVVSNKEVYDLVCRTEEQKWNPQSVVDAQFSLPFTVASAAVHGAVSLDTFQPAGLADAAVRALLPRVRVTLEVEAQGEGRGTFPMPGVVTVRLASGAEAKATKVYVTGHPNNPMTFEDVARKFRICADFAGMERSAAERVIALVRKLEDVPDAAEIARLAAVRPAAAARPRLAV
ncbi:hypothetical protein STAQ_03930 [Allostella sp. ATCC 35155]|nr:hypothetical protein STAQ_03930 [Stella sp. ATCC 35155]